MITSTHYYKNSKIQKVKIHIYKYEIRIVQFKDKLDCFKFDGDIPSMPT